jgi:hypothetical protein
MILTILVKTMMGNDYMNNMKTKNIPIKEETFLRLGKHKTFQDSWDKLINRILDYFEKK